MPVNHRFMIMTRATIFACLALLVFGAVNPLAAQADPGELKRQFETAFAAKDYATMKSLVNRNKDSAANVGSIYENEYCSASVKDDKVKAAKTLELYEQLALTFKIEHEDSLLVTRRDWIQTLPPESMQRRIDVFFKYAEAWDAFAAAQKEGGDEPFREVMPKFKEIYDTCIGIKDYLYAGHAAYYLSEGHSRLNDPFGLVYWCKKALAEAAVPGELQKNFTGLEQRISNQRERDIKKPELIDITLDVEASRAKYEKDFADGQIVKDPGAGADDKGTKSTGSSAGLGVLVPPKTTDAYDWVEDSNFKSISFDPIKRLVTYSNPNVNNKQPTRFPFNAGFRATKGDKDKELRALPSARYSYDGKFHVDPDGSEGKMRAVEVKLSFKPEPVKFNVEFEDGSKATMNFFMFKEPSSFTMFGEKFEYSDASQANILWYGASAVKGTCRGHSMILVDGNGDGRFDSTGEDTIIVDADTSKERVEPQGRYVFLEQGDGYYPYEIKVVQANGGKVRTRPYQGELAPLKVEWTGKIKPRFLLAKGTGEDSAFYFDAMKAIDKPIWLPAGNYNISNGFFREGIGSNKERYGLIGKGRSGNFAVEAGRLNTWQLGGSGEKGFWMLCTVQRGGEDPSDIEVVGADLQVYGNFGEEYLSFYEDRVMPKVEVRRSEPTGAKLKDHDMKPPAGSLTEAAVFYPGTLRMKQMPKSKVVIKLRADHAFLGKIESEWLEVN